MPMVILANEKVYKQRLKGMVPETAFPFFDGEVVTVKKNNKIIRYEDRNGNRIKRTITM